MKKRYLIPLVLLAISVIMLLWARFISTSGLEVHEIEIRSAKLPDSFQEMKVVHFTDLHYGRTVDKKRFDSIVETINKIDADMVFFTGDLIEENSDITSKDIQDITEGLKNIKATLGKYAVVGNHDYYNTSYKKILEDSDFILLNNNYDIVYKEGYTPIFVGGLGSYVYNDADVKPLVSYFTSQTEEEPLYKILLIHEGDVIDEIKDAKFDLIVGGHSHNGQVRLPFIGAIYNTYGAKKYYKPHYTVDDTEVYISNGIGCSGLSFRFFNKPSINYYRFKKEA